jgi:hypothetical protein
LDEHPAPALETLIQKTYEKLEAQCEICGESIVRIGEQRFELERNVAAPLHELLHRTRKSPEAPSGRWRKKAAAASKGGGPEGHTRGIRWGGVDAALQVLTDEGLDYYLRTRAAAEIDRLTDEFREIRRQSVEAMSRELYSWAAAIGSTVRQPASALRDDCDRKAARIESCIREIL